MSEKPELRKLTLVYSTYRGFISDADGSIPWQTSEDLTFFKKFRQGKWLIMGRNTWESIPGSLPGSDTIVLTSHGALPPGSLATPAASKDIALYICDQTDRLLPRKPRDIVIAGGAGVYHDFAPIASDIIETRVDVFSGALPEPPGSGPVFICGLECLGYHGDYTRHSSEYFENITTKSGGVVHYSRIHYINKNHPAHR